MSTDPANSSKRALAEMAIAIWHHTGAARYRTIAVILLAAAMEGAGLFLLLPIVETIFASEGDQHSGLTGRFAAWLAQVGIDTVLEQLAVLGAGFVTLIGIRSIVLLHRDILILRLAQGFVDRIRSRLFSLLAHAEWPVIKRYRRADLLNTMTTNVSRLAQAMRFLSNSIVMCAMTVAYLSAAFFISIELGLTLLVLITIGLLVAVAWLARSHRLGWRLNRANRNVMRETTTFLDGMKAAKAARAEDALTARFDATVADSRAIAIEFVAQQGRLRNAVQFAAAIAALGVLAAGHSIAELSGAELLVMAAIVLRLAPAIAANLAGFQSLAHALPAYEAIRQSELELAKAGQDSDNDSDDARRPASSPPDDCPISLHDVVVDARSFDGSTVTLVTAEDITIAPGMLVHVSGPSGSGKSSLVELLAGLHLPSAGSVKRGDFALTAQNQANWQKTVSFAPQEPFIFPGTVRQNLLWPNLIADEEELWAAIELAEAVEVVRGLPLGLDEPLLDGGARLSGGERQRLCFARAMLPQASLIILDEATSAMDADLERRIVGKLKAELGRRIAVFVSHSLNAASHADCHLQVSEGRARIVSFCSGDMSERPGTANAPD